MLDKEYKTTLARELGINDVEFGENIIGPQTFIGYLSVLKESNFAPGKRLDFEKVDTFDNSNINNGSFCANLHVHTHYSDGISDVKTILDDSLKFAEKKPFLLGITDHDTVEGAKEALSIVSKDYNKYKNIKIVPGVEISTVGTHFKKQTGTLDIHTLLYGINPFDKRLNNFLDEKRRSKFSLAEEVLNKLKFALSELLASLQISLSLEEASKIHPMITKGQDEVSHPLKKYIYAKILFSYYVENNTSVLERLKKYGISKALLSYEKPVQKYKKMFNNARYFYIYKNALEKYLAFLTGEKEQFILNEIPKNIIDNLLRAKMICEENHPSLEIIQPAFSSFEETLAFISSLDFGIISIAHPARLKLSNINTDIRDFFSDFWAVYKKYGGDRALCYEKYYQSYDRRKYFSYLEDIDAAAEKYSFLFTGGIDSHGDNVIRRCPYS